MPVSEQELLGQLFSGATALAGLILVFLGGVLSGYLSYETDQQGAVKRKFRIRAWFAFAGFLLALSSAAFGLAGQFCQGGGWLALSLTTLALSAVLLVVMAMQSVLEIS